ncbi:TlpA disulfide reductase family protein [Afipia sp. 1NLS2]|uniref:TlpA family protein disulfide reductase n=1 Tax=Afipia sp. 1NLS2 TaxID=666684 RepID=UPI0001D9F96A|nr:TlpA disulfide reductase family protein [Afipia sp. 1NLS2]EFI53097.1 alkyl hydroperoxide reductase/ Thiol specific antioxidant/ Mal allergen [Afipia sp. 1NLS2]
MSIVAPNRSRRGLLLSGAAALGVVAIILGISLTMYRAPPHEMAALSAIGITPIAPPKPVPTFSFVDEAGHTFRLADLKGRAVLLNLWATWCAPCREEMPSLDRLQAKLGGARLQVLAVSIDRQGVSVVRPFYRDLGLHSLGIDLDPSGRAPSVFGIEGLPATLLIDAQGREIGRKVGPLQWDSAAVTDTLQHVFLRSASNPQTSEERNSP